MVSVVDSQVPKNEPFPCEISGGFLRASGHPEERSLPSCRLSRGGFAEIRRETAFIVVVFPPSPAGAVATFLGSLIKPNDASLSL